jgi:NhaA family Na+:H+ antiporter
MVLELEDTCASALAPLQKAEHALHGWVAFLILPLFALANSGVALAPTGLAGDGLPVALGIALGLLLGKPAGLLATTWLATRTGLAVLPPGVDWRHLIGAGCLAGIGFTMALFIATLGFGAGALLDAAKIGIFVASAIAAVAGYLVLRAAPGAA